MKVLKTCRVVAFCTFHYNLKKKMYSYKLCFQPLHCKWLLASVFISTATVDPSD